MEYLKERLMGQWHLANVNFHTIFRPSRYHRHSGAMRSVTRGAVMDDRALGSEETRNPLGCMEIWARKWIPDRRYAPSGMTSLTKRHWPMVAMAIS